MLTTELDFIARSSDSLNSYRMYVEFHAVGRM